MKNILVVIVLMGMLSGFGALGYGYHLTVGMETKSKQFGFAAIATAWTLAFIPIVRRVAGAVPPGDSPAVREARKRAKAQAEEMCRTFDARRRARIAEFEADPRLRKYIKDVEMGLMLTDFELEYAENPEKTLTCEHLAPVELAMRRAGIKCRPSTNSLDLNIMMIVCTCRLDWDKLRQTMPLTRSVKYQHNVNPRDGDDYRIVCTDCQGFLWMEDYADAPPFPV